MSARDELRKYVHLLGDSWTPRSQTDERVERLYATVAAEVLREAADEVVADADRLDRALKARTETAATKRSVANDLRHRADEVGGGRSE